MNTVIVFAGTTEGRKLSEMLAKAGIKHTVCVASDYGESLIKESENVTLSKGRLDEEEMERLFKESLSLGGKNIVVDATHPYATKVTENIQSAAKKCGIRYIRVIREREDDSSFGSDVRIFDDITACAAAIEDKGNILLTTGSKELSEYCAHVSGEVKDRTYVRILPSKESITICEDNGIAPSHIIAMHGPFSEGLNREICLQYGIKHLVTKESGSRGGFDEKINAAKALGINVYVIKRPTKEDGLSVEEAFFEITGKKPEKKAGSEGPDESRKVAGISIILAGVGPGDKKSVTNEVSEAIEEADAIFGAPRLLSGINKKSYALYRAADIIPVIKKEKIKKAVILFSGDAGFFSGARSFKEAVKNEEDIRIKILPGISSFSYMASRIGESYEDALLTSIHGSTDDKDISGLVEKIRYNKKVFSLLSNDEDVRKIGSHLVKEGIKCSLFAGIDLSYENEKIIKLTEKEASGFHSAGVICLFVINESAKKRELICGFDDKDFERHAGRIIPMTKECIRHESIRRLCLKEGDVVFDIGGGTGSVAIEIAKQDPSLKVFTIEKKKEAADLIRKNREKFGAFNLTVLEGEATEVMKTLKDPDAVFIGGSSGKLGEMIADLSARNKSIKVVVNAILPETVESVFKIAKEYDIADLKCTKIAVTDTLDPLGERTEDKKNPVTIFSFTLSGAITRAWSDAMTDMTPVSFDENRKESGQNNKLMPRAVIAASGSGSGKTVFTCALIRIMQGRGKVPAAFKCGPDYIDPMFHEKVLNSVSENLDLFFSSEDEVRRLVLQASGDCAVIEGVMGLYDGMSVKETKGSCYEIASVTGSPIILIVRAKGSGRTLISQIMGVLNDDKDKLIKAIVLNEMSAGFYEKFEPELKKRLKAEGSEVRIAGFIPVCREAEFGSRHLGLMLPDEIEDLNKRIDKMCEVIEKNVDIDLIEDIMVDHASGAVEGNCAKKNKPGDIKAKGLTLAVARDEAFCFYYKENLRMFEERGVKIRYFSPLKDKDIPKEADGFILGGGYPELHLKQLSDNVQMKKSVLRAIESGMPSLAECGGFMYLHESISDKEQNEYPMVGVVKGKCRYAGHLLRFGYLMCDKDEGFKGLKGHEFHYYESDDNGEDISIVKPDGSDERKAMHAGDDHLWGFPHFYYGSKPEFVDEFIEKMRIYHDRAL